MRCIFAASYVALTSLICLTNVHLHISCIINLSTPFSGSCSSRQQKGAIWCGILLKWSRETQAYRVYSQTSELPPFPALFCGNTNFHIFTWILLYLVFLYICLARPRVLYTFLVLRGHVCNKLVNLFRISSLVGVV